MKLILTHSVAYAIGPSLTMSSTKFWFQNLVFGNLFEFSVKKSFNIQELLHRKSKCHETKMMHPSLRAFQRDQERDLKQLDSMDLISINKIKQTNNLPS
jgi:hypothetical protein